ncbi:MAG: hypothetical protein LBK94_03555 [Prevotellaceae bacterium]|jgi:hypothetical protein|nr:hypothetical protein [Prevotellaceae bacterium]
MTTDKLDILLKEYDIRHSIQKMYIEKYEQLVTFMNLYFSVFSVLIGYIISDKGTGILTFLQSLGYSNFTKNFICVILLTLFACIMYFILSYILDKLFMMGINGARIQVLEKLLNKETQSDYLIFENKIIPYFLGPKLIYVNGAFKPPIMIAFWMVLVVLIYSVLLCCLCFFIANTFFVTFSLFIFFFTTFTLCQFYYSINMGSDLITQETLRLSGLQKHGYSFVKKNPMLFPILTITLGFLSFALLALKDNTFFLNSDVSFPFLSLPTIFIGDLVFLPIIMYKIGKMFLQKFGFKFIKQHKVSIILISLLSIAICIFVNLYTHKVWCLDEYDGFMDKGGILTTAGKWHLVFSIVIMFFIIWLLIMNFYCIIKKFKKESNCCFNTWIIFVCFTALSIFDVLFRYCNFNSMNYSFTKYICTEWSSFLTLYLSIIMLITLFITKKLKFKTYD